MTRRIPLVLCGAAILFPAMAGAAVWKRNRKDGTVEFTNVPRGGKAWRPQGASPPVPPRADSSPAGTTTPAAATAPLAATTLTSNRGPGAFWFRERADGVVEFTNLHPVGARWKVLFKTGPGKAGALRGATDRVPASDSSPERFTRYDEHIRDQQALYGVPPALLRAVIKTESDFDPHVVSSVGAQGLMQLMPGTGREMGVTDPFDPRQNIMGGARYLQVLARRYCRTPLPDGEASGGAAFHCNADEQVKVIAGYQAGPGSVDKYGGLPPYQTTRSYVANVLSRFERFLEQERRAEAPR